MGWGWLVSALPYGQMWKDRRRMFQSYFNPGNAAAYQPAQAIHTAKTLLKLLEKPSAFLEVTRQYATLPPSTAFYADLSQC